VTYNVGFGRPLFMHSTILVTVVPLHVERLFFKPVLFPLAPPCFQIPSYAPPFSPQFCVDRIRRTYIFFFLFMVCALVGQ